MRTPTWKEAIEMSGTSKPVPIPEVLLDLLKDGNTVKAVATLGEDGAPFVIFHSSLTSLNGKTLLFSEDLEKAKSNVNLVRSIWFDKPVAVSVKNGNVSYAIETTVHRCLIVGKTFEYFLNRKREIHGDDADITAVWELLPTSITETSPHVLKLRQEEKHPYFDCHLDRSSIKKD
jgi:hypothetical protein